MTDFTLTPAALPGISEREAIADVMYRVAQAYDTGDVNFLDSAFTQDATFELAGNVMNGLDAVKANSFNPVAKMDTTHLIGNMRVNWKEGDTKASLSCTAMAQHYRAGEGHKEGATFFMTGCLYYLDVVKDETTAGLWKASTWKVKIIWREGDIGAIKGVNAALIKS
ncbi:hypothetical protein M426DRAFT_18429 [Hypoxylon sp. CI-4A]|nr:hypothetical protein M426DRAFT_18429 [Hypoxylon sp. CI-4A]